MRMEEVDTENTLLEVAIIVFPCARFQKTMRNGVLENYRQLRAPEMYLLRH